MSSSNFMDLNGSGADNMSKAVVTTIPSHISTTVTYHSHHHHDSSEDEETVAIVIACVLISLMFGWFSSWVYRMVRDRRREIEAVALDMVEEAVVTVEESNTTGAVGAVGAVGTESTEGTSHSGAVGTVSTEGTESNEHSETGDTSVAGNTSQAEVTNV